MQHKTNDPATGKEITIIVPLPQPADAPLLTFETVAAYLGNTADGVRAILKGTHETDKELANVLRSGLVTLSSHRRFIRRDILLAYLRRKAGIDEAIKKADLPRVGGS